MAKEIFNRQELKFIINLEQRKYLLAAASLYMQPDTYNSAGKKYRIYNLYIDTKDHALIRHSLTKPIFKEKIRIRSYEPLQASSLVFLEMKKRYKKITNKRRSKILYDEALQFIQNGTPPAEHPYMNRQVVDEFTTRFQTEQYYPMTFITYDRLALVSREKASDLRITFDTNLTTRRYGETTEKLLLAPDKIIMEVKSTENIPLWLVEILGEIGVYKQSYSKYGQEYLGYLRDNNTKKRGEVYA